MARASSLLIDLGEVLYRRTRWSSRAEIAEAMDVHQQVITPWLNYLEFFRVTRERGDGIEVSEDRLLGTIAAYRTGNLRPERPSPITGDPEELRDRLEAADVPHAFAMFTAANRWAFYEPHNDIHLYISRRDRTKVREAIDSLQPSSGQGRGQLQVFHESIDGLATQQREGLKVTTPFQTVVDLRAHPQGGAHADFLENNLLPRLRREAE